jgi:predicted oxidoreductase
MKTQRIGTTDLIASRISFGSARLGLSPSDGANTESGANAIRCYLAAYDAGYTIFDHSDVYCAGMSEAVFGETLRQTPGMRDKVVIATKCTVVPPGWRGKGSGHCYDSSKEHILRACDLALKRLGTDYIDLYQLHRPDLLMRPPEVAEAFDVLKKAGKVREFGVCNYLPSFLSALQAHCPIPIVSNQVEIHLLRLDCFYDGTLDQCVERTITPLAFAPVGGGPLGAEYVIDPNHPRRELLTKLHAAMDEIAAKHGVSRTVIAIAWLLKHPSGMIPIVGSTKPERIREAAKADEVELTREEWYRLLIAARGQGLP